MVEDELHARFDQWTGNRTISTFGTNSGSETIPFQWWRHFKEAFAPEIVYEAIKSCKTHPDNCIDPFGGSGTTALACQFLGVRPTTIEVNPFLADLIEAKLKRYNTEKLARDLGTLLRSASRSDGVAEAALLSQLPATFVEPGVADRWIFQKDVAERIMSIRVAIDGITEVDHRRFFRVILGGILVDLSNVVINGKGRRYRKNWKSRTLSKGDVDFRFANAASIAIGELGRFGLRPVEDYSLIRGDCREALANCGNFEIAIFSPPYPNSFDYTDVYNIELWTLGYIDSMVSNRALRSSTLTSHVQIKRNYAPAPVGSIRLERSLEALVERKNSLWNRNIPDMIGAYFAEMLGIMQSLNSALINGGSIWAVVGDSRYAGVPFNVASILAELAEANGIEVVRVKTLREMRTSAQQGGQTQLAESLLVLRKV